MSVEQNKAVVRRWHEILNERDLDAFEQVLHPDYVNRSSQTEIWGKDERMAGLEATKTYWAELFKRPDLFVTVLDEVIAEGDLAAARVTWVVDGKPIGGNLALFRLQDGKIIDDFLAIERSSTPGRRKGGGCQATADRRRGGVISSIIPQLCSDVKQATSS